MIPAQSMGKHDCRTAAGALVVDLGPGILDNAARDNGLVTGCGQLFFLRLAAGRYERASSGEAGEFREIATRNHGIEISIVAEKGDDDGMTMKGTSGCVSSDFLDAVPEMAPQKSPESYAVGVSDARCDFFHTLVSRLQQMHGALDTQLLKIR